MFRLKITRLLIVGFIAATLQTSCTSSCGDDDTPTTEVAGPNISALLAGLPAAKEERLSAMIPSEMEWVLSSRNPREWMDFADARAFVSAMKKTPLVEDLKVSGPWLLLEGVRSKLSRVSSVVSTKADQDAFFDGPVAMGGVVSDDESTKFVVVKRIDPGMIALGRLVSSFLSLADLGAKVSDAAVLPTVSATEIHGVTVRRIERGRDVLAYALMKNLLVFGSDTALVERTVTLARKESGVDAVVDKGLKDMLNDDDTPGIHVAHVGGGEGLATLLAVSAHTVSLSLDENAPVKIRVKGNLTDATPSMGLFKYAPASTFFAAVDGRAVQKDIWKRVLNRESGVASPKLDALLKKVQSGTGFFIGVVPEDTAGTEPAAVVVMRHGDAKAIDPLVVDAIRELTGKTAVRTVLESSAGAVLIQAPTGVTAAVTSDAVIIGLGEDRVRAVLDAGLAKSPRLTDAARLPVDGKNPAAIYVDFNRGAAFLSRYAEHWMKSDPGAPTTAMDALGPTFDGVAKAGRGIVEFNVDRNGILEGAYRVIP